MFTAKDHEKLSTLFDPRVCYPGYRPAVIEAPNGDGNLDHTKRYLHVAPKYNPPAWALEFLARAHYEACRVAEVLGVPAEFYPRVADGTLRVLEYPEGAGSAQHTDFDLFTLALYRSTPRDLIFDDAHDTAAESHTYREQLRAIHPGLHMGEIGELVGLGPATPHRVRPAGLQRSIVYFAMPSHDAWLYPKPGKEGMTVGSWLRERIARSRY